MEGLVATLDGKPLELDPIGVSVSTPPGDAGVPTLRIECRFASSLHQGTLKVENRNFPDRVGWREITVASTGTPITSDLPATSPSGVLTSYPDDGTSLDVRTATIEVGSGAVAQGEGATGAVERLGSLIRFDRLGLGAALASVAAAIALGIGHALAPGHGKTLVAAYLVGTRATVRQAILLAATTAVSHTLGVAVLGLILATATRGLRLRPALSLPVGRRRGRRARHRHPFAVGGAPP
jgi:hypothetical protein